MIMFRQSGLAVSSFLNSSPMAPAQQWGCDIDKFLFTMKTKSVLDCALMVLKLQHIFIRFFYLILTNRCVHGVKDANVTRCAKLKFLLNLVLPKTFLMIAIRLLLMRIPPNPTSDTELIYARNKTLPNYQFMPFPYLELI